MKYKIIFFVFVVIIIVGLYQYFAYYKDKQNIQYEKVLVEQKTFTVSINATGSVEPMNKVLIVPPIAGRIDKIFVEEGETVKKGQQIAVMSSTSRAAVLDMITSDNKDEYEKWNNIFLPTPIVAPVDGLVIKKNIVNGQTVNLQSELFVISDQFIVKAFVDETDIGKIKEKMVALVSFDAYLNQSFEAIVNKISYQSMLVNNVNIYPVELVFKDKISFLRAGMSANVDFVIYTKDNALVIPVWAVDGQENTTVTIMDVNKREINIQLGMSNGEYVEVLAGLNDKDVILTRVWDFSDKVNNKVLTNPLAPKRMGARARHK